MNFGDGGMPGLGAYLTGREHFDRMQNSQQARQVTGFNLQEAQRKAAMEQAFRSGLRPDMTQEELAAHASRFAGPDTLLKIQQGSLDRKSAAEDRAMQFALKLKAQEDKLAQEKELALSRAADKASQDAVNNEFRNRQLVLEEQNKRFMEWATRENLDIKRLLADRDKPITEFQGKNATYGSRAAMSDRTLTELEEKISLVGLATKESLQNAPVIGGALGAAANTFLSADQQKVEQAQRNFVNAVLRQESGAVISNAEFDNAKKQYFPQPGDSKQVIEQKRANRQAAINGFKQTAGPAWKSVEEQLRQSAIPAAPTAPPRPVGSGIPPPPPGFTINAP